MEHCAKSKDEKFITNTLNLVLLVTEGGLRQEG